MLHITTVLCISPPVALVVLTACEISKLLLCNWLYISVAILSVKEVHVKYS